jgi:DNA repair protein RadA/Sms
MQKLKTQYICQSCGCVQGKWIGKCPDCLEWNSFIEEVVEVSKKNKVIDEKSTFQTLDSIISDKNRIATDISEFDRVLGGGLVEGSAILIGGDPGIGKSTLLLQMVANLSLKNIECAYISGEESISQIQLRAKRINVNKTSVKLLSETNVDTILALLRSNPAIKLVVVDSIQTVFSSELSSSPGTVSQVKACAHELIKLAKEKNIIMVLVGHVTKDGQLAGPKILEHLVDAVLYFENENNNYYRIIRGIKNRFGAVNEIGVFEMTDTGINEIKNPSALFLSPHERLISGTTVFSGIEGTRPILVEIQSLVAPSYLPTPRRSVVGWDINRLSMVLAVIGSRYELNLANKEIYLNVVGGMKISEPAADLAAICSIISSARNKPLPPKTICFGEVGLSGEIRKVSFSLPRIKEAKKLGFKKAIIPYGSKIEIDDFEILEVAHVKELKDIFS